MSLGQNDIFISSLAVISGLLLGKIKVKGINLGTSGTLFTGLLFGLMGFGVPDSYFSWNLVIFVVAVGLLASEDALEVVRRFGFKFIALGIVATSVGALVTLLLVKILSTSSIDPLLLAGAYTGALTSSPGLGAALEATNANAMVTIGYTLTYPFGVVAVVLFVQVAASIFHIDVEKEKEELHSFLAKSKTLSDRRERSVPFAVVSFVLCMVLGIMLGKVSFLLPKIGHFSLGTTGGALIVSLVLGSLGKVGPFQMRMDTGTLVAFRSISLAYFLATVGLMAGPKVAATFANYGLLLICIGFFAALFSELVTFFVGRYFLKLNWVLLAGTICGAMTSTPGLGAAIEATGSEESGAGYGATYPVALLCMVIFTKLIIRLF
ncbi:MAG: YidE/YbjL duplication [Synergistales bacterium]|nr:YidE/YbjL duplication [Synergistales bacterium]